MNKIHLVSLACASLLSFACLQAQTGVGERHIDVGLLIDVPNVDYVGTGYGAGAKFNFPVASTVDLHATIGATGFEMRYEDLYYGMIRGGITFHTTTDAGKFFLTAEVGADRAVLDFGYDEYTQDAFIVSASVGHQFNIGQKFQIAPYVTYEYYNLSEDTFSFDDTDGGAFAFGVEAALRLGRVVSLIGGAQVTEDEDVAGMFGVRFHF